MPRTITRTVDAELSSIEIVTDDRGRIEVYAHFHEVTIEGGRTIERKPMPLEDITRDLPATQRTQLRTIIDQIVAAFRSRKYS